MNQAIKHIDDFWKEREHQILMNKLKRFFEKWQPKEPEAICEFHADFIYLIQNLHRDSHEMFHKTIVDLSNCVIHPILLTKAPAVAGSSDPPTSDQPKGATSGDH